MGKVERVWLYKTCHSMCTSHRRWISNALADSLWWSLTAALVLTALRRHLDFFLHYCKIQVECTLIDLTSHFNYDTEIFSLKFQLWNYQTRNVIIDTTHPPISVGYLTAAAAQIPRAPPNFTTAGCENWEGWLLTRDCTMQRKNAILQENGLRRLKTLIHCVNRARQPVKECPRNKQLFQLLYSASRINS